MKCAVCGAELKGKFCTNCGTPAPVFKDATDAEDAVIEYTVQNDPVYAEEEKKADYESPSFAAEARVYAAPQAQPAAQPEQGSGMGVAALVLGIVGMFTCWTVIGAVLSILALIFGIIGVKRPGKGMAIAGIVLGALGIIIAIAVAAITIMAVGYFSIL